MQAAEQARVIEGDAPVDRTDWRAMERRRRWMWATVLVVGVLAGALVVAQQVGTDVVPADPPLLASNGSWVRMADDLPGGVSEAGPTFMQVDYQPGRELLVYTQISTDRPVRIVDFDLLATSAGLLEDERVQLAFQDPTVAGEELQPFAPFELSTGDIVWVQSRLSFAPCASVVVGTTANAAIGRAQVVVEDADGGLHNPDIELIRAVQVETPTATDCPGLPSG